MMPFNDRADAGRRLVPELVKYRDRNPLLLALPRGGVPVAAEIAEALGAPMDLVLVRKLGVPFQPELAMGAVADGPTPLIVRNEDVIRRCGIPPLEFERIVRTEVAEIGRRRALYLGSRPHPSLKGRVAIVVDDGIATGATTRAALRSVRQQEPERLILAVPVAPTSTLGEIEGEADEIVCLEDHEPFGAIGFFYQDFRQVSDDEVKDTLARFVPPPDGDARRGSEANPG